MNDLSVKERILEVSAKLFLEQGYHLTGINQIIDEAEIARGSLYNHFKSKHELLMSYLRQAEETWFLDLENYLMAIQEPGKKVLALFDHRIDLQKRSGFSGCRFIKISTEIERSQTEVFAFVSGHKKKYKNLILRLVKRIPLQPPLSAEMLAEMIFLFLEGASLIGASQKDSEHLKEAKKIITRLI